LKILQSFIPIFIENAQKLVDDLSVNVGKTEEFDMLSYTAKNALNMICGELKKSLEKKKSIVLIIYC
jgi:DNA/RNA-binding domain of Phe-tRNA-synthetase-like protein